MKTQNIWESFSLPLLGFIKSKVPAEDAEDVLQEAFIKIHSKIDSLDDDRKLQSWVYQTTRNTINDYYRSKKRLIGNSDNSAPVDIDTAPDQHDHVVDNLSQCLGPLINELSENHKEAIHLSEIHGLKHSEIAEKLNLSLTAVKSRVRRGKQELMERFIDHCNFHMDEHGKLRGEHLCDQEHDCNSC